MLSMRKTEGISLARTMGMTKERIKSYFDLLKSILEETDLFQKPL